MRRQLLLAALAAFGLSLPACDDSASPAVSEPSTAESTSSVPRTTADVPEADATSTAEQPTRPVVILFVTNQKDGDSWDASDGNEYRLGLVNAPDVGEPCSGDATAFTARFLADGFSADRYSTDTYGRHVAEVFDRSGRSLNIALAKSGLGNDRYLEQFRYENPDLGRRLDAAFASAAVPSCATAPPERRRTTCVDVTSYDNNWDNDMKCTRPDGSVFYTDYDGARRAEAQ